MEQCLKSSGGGGFSLRVEASPGGGVFKESSGGGVSRWRCVQVEVCLVSGWRRAQSALRSESLGGVLLCAYSSARLSTSLRSPLVPVPLATSRDPPDDPPRWEHTAAAQSQAATATQPCHSKPAPM